MSGDFGLALLSVYLTAPFLILGCWSSWTDGALILREIFEKALEKTIKIPRIFSRLDRYRVGEGKRAFMFQESLVSYPL